tara:strand:- start:728 stop:1075 length:348 start_codon:yes stop_codon:yes gene_type:complete
VESKNEKAERYLIQNLFKSVVPNQHVEKLYEMMGILADMGIEVKITNHVPDASKMEISLQLWIDEKIEYEQVLKGDMTETYFFFQHCKNKILDLLAMAIYTENKNGVIGRIGSIT